MSGSKLFKCSQGWFDDGKGNAAVVMVKQGVKNAEGYRTFSYRPTYTAEPITIVWHEAEPLSLFPSEIGRYLLDRGYARNPTEAELELYESLVAQDAKREPSKPVEEDSASNDSGAKKPEGAAPPPPPPPSK